MNTDCAAFERWLDEGRPAEAAAARCAHAASCTRCGALLELEQALALPAAHAARADFTDAVMRRVHDAPAPMPVVTSWLPMPALVQMIVDPVMALSITALALLVLERRLLWALGTQFAARWSTFQWPAFVAPGAPELAQAWHAFGALSASPGVLVASAVAFTPVLLMAAWMLFRWTDRWVSGGWSRPAPVVPGAHAAAR